MTRAASPTCACGSAALPQRSECRLCRNARQRRYYRRKAEAKWRTWLQPTAWDHAPAGIRKVIL